MWRSPEFSHSEAPCFGRKSVSRDGSNLATRMPAHRYRCQTTCRVKSECRGLLRLVGSLPRRDGAAARGAGVRQASKEETAEHRAGAADVMGIVALASGAEQRSVSRSG